MWWPMTQILMLLMRPRTDGMEGLSEPREENQKLYLINSLLFWHKYLGNCWTALDASYVMMIIAYRTYIIKVPHFYGLIWLSVVAYVPEWGGEIVRYHVWYLTATVTVKDGTWATEEKRSAKRQRMHVPVCLVLSCLFLCVAVCDAIRHIPIACCRCNRRFGRFIISQAPWGGSTAQHRLSLSLSLSLK